VRASKEERALSEHTSRSQQQVACRRSEMRVPAAAGVEALSLGSSVAAGLASNFVRHAALGLNTSGQTARRRRVRMMEGGCLAGSQGRVRELAARVVTVDPARCIDGGRIDVVHRIIVGIKLCRPHTVKPDSSANKLRMPHSRSTSSDRATMRA
jgi:hypothetical protein